MLISHVHISHQHNITPPGAVLLLPVNHGDHGEIVGNHVVERLHRDERSLLTQLAAVVHLAVLSHVQREWLLAHGAEDHLWTTACTLCRVEGVPMHVTDRYVRVNVERDI